MAIKLKRLHVKNFKVYSDRLFDFENNDLIIFDGPNGFGKTTVYDAIELLFTGRIKRYDRLVELLVDGREWRKENPLHHYGATNENIEIRLSFYHDSKELIWAVKNDRPEEAVIDFNYFKLHVVNQFDDPLTTDNEVPDDERIKVLGNTYRDDFQFIHYIEQEDTFAYLRSSEKQKSNSISYLFNTADFNLEIGKYQGILDQLNTCINGESGLRQQTQSLQEEIKEIEASYKTQAIQDYQRLFGHYEFEWDKNEVDFDKMPYSDIVNSEDGILTRIQNLLSHKEEFLKYRHNRILNRCIDDEQTLRWFYYYEGFRNRVDTIRDEREFYNEVKEFKQWFEDFEFERIAGDFFDLPTFLKVEHSSISFFSEYKKQLASLRQSWKESTSIEKIHAKIQTARDSLLSHLEGSSSSELGETKCSLCGTEFSEHQELLTNIKQYGEELEKYHSELGKRIANEIEEFLKLVREKVIPELERIISELLYQPKYFEMDFFNPETFLRVDQFKRSLDRLNFSLDDYYAKVADKEADWQELVMYLESQRQLVAMDSISSDFDNVFRDFFDSKKELVERMTAERIEDKRKYLAWRHSVFQSESLKLKQEKYSVISDQYNKLNDYAVKLKRLITTMQESLSWYNHELIKDVELLFHIYSGRIVQDFQGGLGLFISNKGNNKIKFVSRPDRTYDAMFSMSTGQLCALVLSFTLALNQKYSKAKLILIDDPVQSMDDINTAGLVEVLRNDFRDRQVLLSTHEQMMSTYMRYRFEKFGMTTKRIDLSSI